MESEEEFEQVQHGNHNPSLLYQVYYICMTSRFVNFLRSMDAQITNNFRQAEIYTR